LYFKYLKKKKKKIVKREMMDLVKKIKERELFIEKKNFLFNDEI